MSNKKYPDHTNTEAYRDGYTDGQGTDNQLKRENQEIRDNDNAARGLLLGMSLISILAVVLGSIYFMNRRTDTPVIVPVPAPTSSGNQSQSSSPKVTEKTIIERTFDHTTEIVPAPQSTVPTPKVDVKVTNPVVVPAPQSSTLAPNVDVKVTNPVVVPTPQPSTPAPNIDVKVSPTPTAREQPTTKSPDTSN